MEKHGNWLQDTLHWWWLTWPQIFAIWALLFLVWLAGMWLLDRNSK